MIGKVLSNRYRLITKLGHGGMAWVYLAEDRREERRVAVKVLYPQLGHDVDFLQRFTQEAKLAMSISQSAPEMHLVQVLDYGSHQDTHYLVMEYVKGRDLRRVLDEDGPLAWQEALDVARQVALALGHAHKHGIVHRDIKPENIMILPDGTIRVLDLGVARARTSPTLTHSGFVGSPYYAAPEQVMGRRVDIRADLYSLGIVMYEMLAGGRPFQSDTPWAVVNQHIAVPPPRLDETQPDLPAAVSQLVRRAMSKRTENRFQTPAEMTQAIEAVLAGREAPAATWTSEPDALAALLEGLYTRAQQAAEAQEWPAAVDLFSQVLRLDPRYQDVTVQLAEAGRQARLTALYTAAQDSFEAGRWSDALARAEEIMADAPDYQGVQELGARARQKQELEQSYQLGVRFLEAGEWAGAIERLTWVHDQDPAYARVADLLSSAYAARSNGPEADPATPRQQPARRRSKPRRNLVWAMLAVLFLFLAIEGTLLYRDQEPPAAAAYAPATSTPGFALPPARQESPTSPGNLPTATSTVRQDSITLVPVTNSPPAKALPGRSLNTASPEPAGTDTAVPVPSATALPTEGHTPQPRLAGQIAFPRFDRERGTYDVHLCQVDGSDCRRVTTQASQPNLLPTGDRVVIHSWQPDDKGILLLDLDGKLVWQISRLIEAARPSVDFQGNAYVYLGREEADRQSRLYRTHATETHPIQREASTVLGKAPAWTPDGRILYSGCLGDACGIILMDADGARPRQIVPGSNEINAEASPDGRQVAFMSLRDGNWEVYVADIDGSNLNRLTRNPANDGLPTWSPDGRHIAFVSNRDGEWAVWAMHPDGSEQRQLFAIGGPLDGQVQNAAPHESHGWIEERISWSATP